jgi:hypothetical protein
MLVPASFQALRADEMTRDRFSFAGAWTLALSCNEHQDWGNSNDDF